MSYDDTIYGDDSYVEDGERQMFDAEMERLEYEFHPISVKCKLCTKSLTDTQERMEQAGWIFTTEGVACDKCIHRHITQILREAGRMSICERVERDTQMHQRQLDAERGN